MISVIIPIHNELENLPLLHQRLIDAGKGWHEDYEIIYIDDGSYDGSTEVLRKMALHESNTITIKLSRNFGHQPAITAGLNYAKGDAVVIMDGDLQDPPEEVIHFIKKWREGYQIVYAVRTKRKENIFKRMGYKLFYTTLARLSNFEIPLDSGDFCLLDKRVVKVLNDEMPEGRRFVRGLRAYAGFKQIGVTYERAKRTAGKTKYPLRKMYALALDGIFDFSTFPLKIATYLGLLFSIPSFFIGIYFILNKLFKFTVLGYAPTEKSGFATLLIGIFFLGGVILFILGIIGEYLGRIYLEVKKRPLYIIDEVIGED